MVGDVAYDTLHDAHVAIQSSGDTSAVLIQHIERATGH